MSLRVAAIQHEIVWHDREANFERLAPMIAGAAAGGAGLVLLTETFSTGFSFDTPGIGESEGGPSSRFLAEQATTHGVWVGGSCPEVAPEAPHDDQRPSNSFVLAGPDGTVHRYRKIHPFSHAEEEKYVRPGTEFVTVTIEGIRFYGPGDRAASLSFNLEGVLRCVRGLDIFRIIGVKECANDHVGVTGANYFLR